MPQTSLPNAERLRLRRLHYALRPPWWSYPWSYHRSCFELYCCMDGQWRVHYPEQSFELQPRQMLLIPPRQAHAVQTSSEGSCLVVVLQFELRKPRLDALLGQRLEPSSLALRYLRDMLDLWGDDAVSDARRRSLLALLLLELLHPVQGVAGDSPELAGAAGSWLSGYEPLVDQVLEHLRINLREPLRMEPICELTGYSESHLRQLFRNATGMSLTEALMQMRLAEAKRLLLYSNFKVGAVAEMLGFKHVPKFNQFFRARMGCTPTQFVAAGRRIGRTWTTWPTVDDADEVRMKDPPTDWAKLSDVPEGLLPADVYEHQERVRNKAARSEDVKQRKPADKAHQSGSRKR